MLSAVGRLNFVYELYSTYRFKLDTLRFLSCILSAYFKNIVYVLLSVIYYIFHRTSVQLDCPNLEKGDVFTQSEFLSRLANECRYDRLLLPTYQTGDTVYVHASAYVYFIQPAEAHDLVGEPLDKLKSKTCIVYGLPAKLRV